MTIPPILSFLIAFNTICLFAFSSSDANRKAELSILITFSIAFNINS
jgi:hypothetical protein